MTATNEIGGYRPPLSDAELRRTIEILQATDGVKQETCRRLGIARSTLNSRINRAVEAGIEGADAYLCRPTPEKDPRRGGERKTADPAIVQEKVRTSLRSGPKKLEELVRSTGGTFAQVLDSIESLREANHAIERFGDLYEMAPDRGPSYDRRQAIVLDSRPDNTFVFGAAGDKHYGSKYHRDDVLRDLYRRFRDAGVDAVFDTGNWIDGDARFNRHDLVAHGLDAQCRLMAKEHPKIDCPTYAVAGDDHEGWYAQREGIDVGGYAERIMREAGHDWTDIGYMEARVILRNSNTGAETIMNVQHPGGGSSYAVSYRPQKIIEAMEGGEKPAVLLLGHYHKLDPGHVRNVWYLQTGTCQDQTPFMRKKSIEAHVGGAIVELEQDPETGAIVGFCPRLYRYFNRQYYAVPASGRWSMTGKPVERAPRSVGGL